VRARLARRGEHRPDRLGRRNSLDAEFHVVVAGIIHNDRPITTMPKARA
jgi:hypothetical protein